METALDLQLDVPPVNVNCFDFSGNLTISQDIKGDIDYVIEPNRCTLDMKTCEKFQNLNINEMCKEFADKNAFYYKVFSANHPKFECPIKAGNYTWERVNFDLSFISMLPLHGYIWIVTVKFVAAEKGSRVKKTILCMNTETKITRGRRN